MHTPVCRVYYYTRARFRGWLVYFDSDYYERHPVDAHAHAFPSFPAARPLRFYRIRACRHRRSSLYIYNIIYERERRGGAVRIRYIIWAWRWIIMYGLCTLVFLPSAIIHAVQVLLATNSARLSNLYIYIYKYNTVFRSRPPPLM